MSRFVGSKFRKRFGRRRWERRLRQRITSAVGGIGLGGPASDIEGHKGAELAGLLDQPISPSTKPASTSPLT
jgi:hypothetical protein